MTNLLNFFGAHWVRLAAAGIVLAALVYVGATLARWEAAAERLPLVEAELELEKACGPGSSCAERQAELEVRQLTLTQEVSDRYAQEIADLRARPVERRVIRVCPDPDHGHLRGTATAGTVDDPGAAPWIISGPDELDTGPLRELAREADEVAARLRALQDWNRELSAD